MTPDDSEDDYVASESDGETTASEYEGQCDASAPSSRTDRLRAKSIPIPAKGYLSKDYRDLLNSEIEKLNTPVYGTEFASSQLGASIWTSHEKSAFFQRLSSCGPGDLAALQRAVGTKSEQEIRVYLSLLQDGFAAQSVKQTKPRKQDAFAYSDIPAAAEISLEGERMLDLAADSLATHFESHAARQEQEKFGDDWIIDGEQAERIDLEQERRQLETDSPATDPTTADEVDGGSTNRSTLVDSKASDLLRPSSFIQLSRSLFMNNGENEDTNWHHIQSVSDLTEPAIFCTALHDFRDIIVSITRRLVQATIFQALSRLRAEDASRKDWTPLAAIREVDVRTAIVLLGLPNDGRRYWATAARRCKVGVYSDSTKFADGRPSAKSGFPLTYDEVEAELGFRTEETRYSSQETVTSDFDEDDVDDMMLDSDLFTEDDSVDAELQSPELKKETKKRRRALSPESYYREEQHHLEALDQVTSAREEKRLWELLRLDPPEQVATDRKVPAGPLGITPSQGAAPSDLARHVEYEAEWESPSGVPPTKRFKEMEYTRKAGKTRRKVLLEEVQRRLDLQDRHQGSEKYALGDDSSTDDNHIDDSDENES